MTKYYDIIVDGPKGGSVSGDVQERAKYIYTDTEFPGYKLNMDGFVEFLQSYKLSDKEREDILKGAGYWCLHRIKYYLSGHAGASSELEALKAENEMLRKKIEQIREDSFSEGYDEGVQDHGE